jgi:hypothetical protein
MADTLERYTQSWAAAAHYRLRFHVHTVDPDQRIVGLHVSVVGEGSPAFSISLSAADAATLGGVLLEAAGVAVDNEDR